jgi:hypothetical protein
MVTHGSHIPGSIDMRKVRIHPSNILIIEGVKIRTLKPQQVHTHSQHILLWVDFTIDVNGHLQHSSSGYWRRS